MRSILSIVVSICALSLPSPVLCNELDERMAIQGEAIGLLISGGYAKLEGISADYLKTKARTASGIWKLTSFYAAFNEFFDVRRKEDKFWAAADYYTQNWIKTYPESSTAHLAYANLLLNRGWSYRGVGPASSVEDQNWEPFFAYTQRAKEYLEKYRSLASNDPHWYVLMALVAKQQGWPEADFVRVVDEGLKLEPNYYQLYFSALDYYLPKWGGNVLEVEKFALKAVERTRPSEGVAMYARIYWSAAQGQYGDALFVDSMVNWNMMKAGIDDVLKKYPDSWNINNFARFACLARDKAKTAELTARIGDAPMMVVWRNPSDFQNCRAWAVQ